MDTTNETYKVPETDWNVVVTKDAGQAVIALVFFGRGFGGSAAGCERLVAERKGGGFEVRRQLAALGVDPATWPQPRGSLSEVIGECSILDASDLAVTVSYTFSTSALGWDPQGRPDFSPGVPGEVSGVHEFVRVS